MISEDLIVKKWKTWQICLFTLLCILLNFGGRVISNAYQLPLWMDSFGTVLSAYLGGPFIGAVIGLTGNLIYGMVNHVAHVYGLISVALGIIVGVAAKKRLGVTLFGLMSVSSLAALVCVLIAMPINFVYSGGRVGNMWGDGVMNFLREQGYPAIICMFVGEFYVEFVDKLITLFALFVTVRLCRILVPRLKKLFRRPPAVTILLVFLLAAAWSRPSEAAERMKDVIDYSDYVQTIFSNNNGLPCGEANDIAQTNDGILWVGTYAGLYRYNGSEFRWMDGYESVRNVNCLYVDSEGRLWIGTNDKGLSISINEKIVNVVDQMRGLPSNSVRCIIQSADGFYYVGTTGSMQILALNSGLKKVGSLMEVNYADKIAADEEGHVAAVTADGRLFLLKGGRVESSLQNLSDEEIFNSCAFDSSGNLLVGTSSKHIYVYDVSEGYFRSKEVIICGDLMNINDLCFFENGDIFVTADNGIGYLDKNLRFHAVNTNEFNNSIENMAVDYQGNLWFTSSRLGLLRLSQSAFKDVYKTIGMPNRVVNSVTKWQDAFYFGTDKGLDVVDLTCRRQVHCILEEEMVNVRIRCLFADSRGNLWICTYGRGLVEVEPDGTEFHYNESNGSFGNRARLVTELSDGTIVAAGDTGMSFIRGHKIEHTIGPSDGLINSMIMTVTELDDGTILAGTDGDGIAVLKDRKVTRMLTRTDGLSSEVILRTVKDTKTGGVFIVTSNGLCYMNEYGSIRPLSNFPYFNNYDVCIKDQEHLFVTGSAGIYVVSRAELLSNAEDIHYDLLDSRKGLNSALTANAWNYGDGQGNLFLCCDKGVFIIDTDRYSADNRSYRMMISSVWLDNEQHRVEKSSPIHIGRGISRVEMYPEIINFSIQDPYIGYYLEGFEDKWTILPQSSLGTIVYTNLPAGSYTLHLAVFDGNKERTLEERMYSIVKDREIYDNHWFKIYMLVIAMLAVAWFTVFIVRTQVQRTINMQRRELKLARHKIQMGNETILAIAKAVDAKDVRTSEHSYRVSEYSAMIGKELGLSDEECENLRKAARMHDIGKIGIPDSILNKPARLTDDEYSVMKSHVVRGGEILKDFTLIDHVVDGTLYHHERYDGKGYPEGLKGEEIPLYGRIIGCADAFDAMTANRVYRKQMDFGYVLEEMRKNRGTQFDPQMVDILLRLIDEGKIDLKKLYPAVEDPVAENKPAEQKESKPADQAANKPAEQKESKPADQAEKKPDNKAEERTGDNKEAGSGAENKAGNKGGETS